MLLIIKTHKLSCPFASMTAMCNVTYDGSIPLFSLEFYTMSFMHIQRLTLKEDNGNLTPDKDIVPPRNADLTKTDFVRLGSMQHRLYECGCNV